MQILVSPQDVHLLALNWRVNSKGYVRRDWNEDGKQCHAMLHRLIAQPDLGLVVDHINGDPLDNRRENLRVCTPSENLRNRKVNKNNKTGLKGVYAHNRRFRAQIRAHGKKYLIGAFDTPEEAHAAYAAEANRLHGEFARSQ